MTPQQAHVRHGATHYMPMLDGVTPQMYYKRKRTPCNDGTVHEGWVYLTFCDLWHGSFITPENEQRLIKIEDLIMTTTIEQLQAKLAVEPTTMPGGFVYKEAIPRIVCKDGTSVSVQASKFTYCAPRNDHGPWSSVELGFPSVKPNDTIMQYAESPDAPTDTVYGYVPLHEVAAWIDEHGGVEE